MQFEKSIWIKLTYPELKEAVAQWLARRVDIPQEYMDHLQTHYWDIDVDGSDIYVMPDGTLPDDPAIDGCPREETEEPSCCECDIMPSGILCAFCSEEDPYMCKPHSMECAGCRE